MSAMGKLGAKVRNQKLTPMERKAIAMKAAAARWTTGNDCIHPEIFTRRTKQGDRVYCKSCKRRVG